MFVCCCRKYLIPPEHLAHDLLLHGAEVGVVAVAEGEVEEGGVGGELVAELRAAHTLHHRHEPAPPAPRPHHTPLILVLSSSSTLTSTIETFGMLALKLHKMALLCLQLQYLTLKSIT